VSRNTPKVVNVASVPQRSPFRYPGGKTWLIPHIRAWLKSLPTLPSVFCEPFAGGGIVSLTVGFEQLSSQVVMVELDADVAAVWRTILEGDAQWLVDRIRDFELSVDAVRSELSQSSPTLRQRAFNTILKNRTFHGGILAHGSGLLKNGENGKGIKSRWYPETLGRRILNIAEIRQRFVFLQTDGIAVAQQRLHQPETVFFFDPPYTAGGKGKRAGRRLYAHSELDHERLFETASQVAGDFLMTYDNDAEVIELARHRGFDVELVAMKNTHHAEMNELLIGKDLAWARAMLRCKRQRHLFE
jgi:DNA adenine methylase